MSINITQTFHFSAAHFYENKQQSAIWNQHEFGKCYSTYGHGHNYKLEIQIPYEVNEGLTKLELQSQKIQSLISQLDHRHLNFDIQFFKENIPTTENISQFLTNELNRLFIPWKSFQLYETADIRIEVYNE